MEGDSTGGLLGLLILLAFIVLMLASMWKVFEKAGEPGWAAIIPIYNMLVLIKISGKPWWWILLLLVPLISIVFIILIYIDLAKKFGRGVGYALGLVFLPFIFFPMLGFGDATYQS